MKFSKTLISALMMFAAVNAFAQKKTEKFEKLQIEMFPKQKKVLSRCMYSFRLLRMKMTLK
jgi:hypothetical protein